MSHYNEGTMSAKSLFNLIGAGLKAIGSIRDRAKKSRDRVDTARNNQKISSLRNDFNRQVDNLKTQNQKLNNEIGTLNSELLNTKKEHNRKFNSLDKKLDATKHELKQDITNLKQNTQKLLKAQNEKIDNITKNLKLEKENKKELASEWLNHLDKQVDMIKTLKHEKFKPNALNELLNQAQLARDNISIGVFEAAIAALQERLIDAQKLFNEVFLLQKEFEELQEIASNNMNDLQILLEAQRSVEYESHEEKINLDVDYWTEGGIKKIENELKEIEDKINNEDTSTKELVDIINRQNELLYKLKNLPEKAKHNFILAQVRVDNANKIIDILDEIGFEAIDDAIENEDNRKSIFVKFENSSKEEIIVSLSPQGEENKISIMFDIDSTNEKFKDHRLNNIIKKLNERDIEVKNFKCTDSSTPRYEINKYKDFEKIKKGEVAT